MTLEGNQKFLVAHKHSSSHEAEIRQSESAGCFHCTAVFPAREIKEWIDEPKGGRTAVCPYCAVDSVLGDASGFAMTEAFLFEMRNVWFGTADAKTQDM